MSIFIIKAKAAMEQRKWIERRETWIHHYRKISSCSCLGQNLLEFKNIKWYLYKDPFCYEFSECLLYSYKYSLVRSQNIFFPYNSSFYFCHCPFMALQMLCFAYWGSDSMPTQLALFFLTFPQWVKMWHAQRAGSHTNMKRWESLLNAQAEESKCS